MKAKLIKTIDGYELFTQGFLKSSTNHGLIESLNIEEGPIRYKLSLKNCQAIERGYDLDELLKKEIANGKLHPNDGAKKEGIERGIQIALEIFGDKKFSEDDMRNAYLEGANQALDFNPDSVIDENKYIQSLQQTQWDVEIEMVCPHPSDTYRCGIQYGCDKDGCNHPNQVPYLDADGCLILKRI